ncbi:MAG: cell division protein ZapA [Clostridia bacterium]|nr:cell division protein ZapA [Clostridia bacterium]
MNEKNKVTVRIAGNEYVISGAESAEYIQKIAMFVDRKLHEITKRNHLLSTSMAAVLASVNMADEMFHLSEALSKTDFELTDLKKKHQELKDELQRVKADNAKLKERESQLQIELTKREAELKEVRNTVNTLNHQKKLSE